MPYNTRRKSLSLSELGIIVPKRARSSGQSISLSTTPIIAQDGPPVKKPKQSHDGSMSPPPLPTSTTMSPPRTTNIHIKHEHHGPSMALSPPPSPPLEGSSKVDLEGINDDIVIATIRQLEATGNRPLFVRELGAILADSLACVEKSANPTALISSRLTQYMARPWPAISPCPLGKDLSPAHPRRLYYYLRTLPRVAVTAEQEQNFKQPKRIISPSLSSASAMDEEEFPLRPRTALSPSPEVDLSSPELDDPSSQHALPGMPFSERNSVTRASSTSSQLADNRRAASPQLEMEERDFKQTANAVYEETQQRRKNSQDQDTAMTEDWAPVVVEHGTAPEVTMSIEGDVGVKDATTLFGHLKSPSQQLAAFSSPVMRPQSDMQPSVIQPIASSTQPTTSNTHISPAKSTSTHATKNCDFLSLDSNVPRNADTMEDDVLVWDDLKCPEHVAFEELDVLFEAY